MFCLVHGGAYIQELTTWHREMLPYAHVQPKRGILGEKSLEILGFPFTDALLVGLESIDRKRSRGKLITLFWWDRGLSCQAACDVTSPSACGCSGGLSPLTMSFRFSSSQP